MEAANWLQADQSSPRSYCCFGQHTVAAELNKPLTSKRGNSLKNLHFPLLQIKRTGSAGQTFFFFFPLFSKNLELSNSLSLDVVCAISIDHPCFPLSAKLAYLILVPDLSLQVTEFATPDTDTWTTWSPAHFICDDKMVQDTPRSQRVKYFNKVPLHTLKTKSVLKKCTHTHV